MARLYGFDDSARTRLRDDEKQVIRLAASRVREGQSLAAVARWMNDQGYRGTLGGAWAPVSLGRLLDNPVIAGLAQDPKTGELYETGLPRIIEPEEFEELRKRQRRPERTTPDFDYMLTGGLLGTCGLCGHALVGARSNSSTPGYRCQPDEEGGCGKVRVAAHLLEDYVGTRVLGELARPGALLRLQEEKARIEAEAEQVRNRLAALEEQRGNLAEDYAKQELGRAAYKAANQKIDDAEKELRQTLRYAEQVAAAPLGGIDDVTGLVNWWNSAPAKSRRALCHLLLDQVEVYQASARGIRHIEDGRVVLRWKSAGGQVS
ncbi:hypothetical protein GCM10020367_21350 [Streptomyces sannanensis]|uniref:Recombinase domain-containing protein n=1 Tax=Streptomyces sannanensis TaxID=285536 RepID=A0ABP6S975_9ACTN